MTDDEGFGQLFAKAGCQGWLCVVDIDGDGQVSAGSDDLVVAASVFKVAVALEVFAQTAAGRLDPGERVRVSPAPRTPGPRLALGFAHGGFQVAAKSGSLLGVIRNEVGVITTPGHRRYAAAVFTRADRPYDNEHKINAVIGTAAARAVGDLGG